MAISNMKLGEKLLFGGFALIGIMAFISWIVLEVVRSRLDKPMFPVLQYEFSEQGKHGSALFRTSGCTICHRAMRNGTNMGLVLDGIGSKRTLEQLNKFLSDPEATYPGPTMDHGPSKGAAFVAEMPQKDLQAIAVFLSELRANPGSNASRFPPAGGESKFIDEMIRMWAPDSWKSEYKDVRDEAPLNAKEN
ncbi:c-type cytochrome [Candidatus Nitrotoga sp. M5]|uniref:c-type cytochrome n=1 Tax=Candidatus Nitrotoga sp. M5 TaxID=2890409 RepID=UPI001EF3928A|nr:c-type cytochrome [Candidatus Nitrotoga sp. M5]CAH1385781.1 Cytochrome c [Candidatus Nitrotoga sp. M5]